MYKSVIVNNDPILTFDVDWAPDWMIDYVARALIENRVRATWFVTHSSPAVDRLRETTDLFELGIHPNCLPGSTHGETDEEALQHLLTIVPEAISMRTHSLYQSSRFLTMAERQYGIRVDVSLFLPRMSHLSPHRIRWRGANLWRVPFFWEDDSEMFEDEPIWRLSDDRLKSPGMKVFDFHPVHVILNTVDYSLYEQLKAKRNLKDWTPDMINDVAPDGPGPRTMFLELVGYLTGRGTWIKETVDLTQIKAGG